MAYNSVNRAFLIGYSSLPFSETHNFVARETQSLFENYRRGIEKYSKRIGNDFELSGLFEPTMYYVWGKYDICAIAEVDDLEFACRFFRSYNTSNEDSNAPKSQEEKELDCTDEVIENFNYRVIMGIDPIFSEPRTDSLPLPYLAVSQFKINSALLIGNGLTIISEVKAYIKQLICDLIRTDDILVDFKICESFSYHEVIIILNSNSICFLRTIVLKIRETKFCDFADKLEDKTCGNRILKNSMLGKMSESAKSIEDYHQVHNHLFESTLTSFGTDFNLFNERNSNYSLKVMAPRANEEITFFSRWNVKPGHDARVAKMISKELPANSDDVNFVAGRGDLIIVKKHITSSLVDKNEWLDFPEVLFKKNDKLWRDIIDTFTSLNVHDCDAHANNEASDFTDALHYNIHNNLKAFTIDKDAIHDLRTSMKTLWTPKVLAEKVLKLISNYNNAVLNPDMYGFYAELYPFIKNSFLETARTFHKNNVDFEIERSIYTGSEFYDILGVLTYTLESAFQNRFYQSYWTSEVPEVNVDYSGGIHNLISAYDGCYKGINNPFEDAHGNLSFVYVKSESKVEASHYSVRMNYLHMIQPINYCAVVTHECCNFILEKWYDKYNRANKDAPDSQWDVKRKEVLRLLQQADIELYDLSLLNFAEVISLNEDSENLISDLSKSKQTLTKALSFSKRLELKDFINKRVMRYFIVDLANLKYSYHDDFSLFAQVHWNYYLQLGYVYRKPRQLEDTLFFSMTIRLALLKCINSKNYSLTYKEFLSIFPDNKSVKDELDEFGDDLFLFISQLFQVDAYKDWFVKWEFLLTPSTDKYAIIPKLDSISGIEKKIQDYFKKYNCDGDIFETLQNEIPGNPNIISPVYLAIVKSYLSQNMDSISYLDRAYGNGEPSPSTRNKGGRDEVFVDPSGGTFVIGRENRKNYLGERIKFLKLLYHVSQLHKKHYIANIFS